MIEPKEYNITVQMLITADSEEDALAQFVNEINTTFLTGELDAIIVVEDTHEEEQGS